MVISFDLDGTLIPYAGGFEAGCSLAGKIAGFEPLRTGTRQLFRQLRRGNHQIYIYTTSYRKIYYIKLLFIFNNLKVDKIINQPVHNKTLERDKQLATKLPNRFGIDLHIDDSEGVKAEGEKYGFRVLVIGEADGDWVEKVLNEVKTTN